MGNSHRKQRGKSSGNLPLSRNCKGNQETLQARMPAASDVSLIIYEVWMVFKSIDRLAQLGAIAVCGWLFTLSPAWAHHAMDSKLPSNGWEGFLSGLAHPVIGLDHLAFVIAIGILSAQLIRGWQLPIFFLVTAMLGTGIHLTQISLPLPEVGVAVSVLVLGIILVLKQRLEFAMLAGLFAIAGLFHGYAYGEAIFGAEMTPLVSYLLGFTTIQAAISFAVYKASQLTQNPVLTRSYGMLVCTIGAVFLATSLKG
jgi:urease accessory protein